MKAIILAALGASCSASVFAQSVSQQFPNTSPPDVPDVEVVGHILKPAPLEPSPERLEQLNLPSGFEINIFAQDLINPRMMAVHSSGAVYVTRREVGDVVRLVDEDGDGVADSQEVVANRPDMHGIAIDGSTMYLVTVESLYRTTIRDDGSLAPLERLVGDLPDGGQHPNRTIQIGPDGMLYLSIGSTCNACNEPNPEHATILQVEPDGSSRTIFASGLRNTVGFAFDPQIGQLWGMDHGTDWLGDNEQHEELNRIVEDGHYGWPFLFDDNQFNPKEEPPGDLTWEDWAARSITPIGLYVAHSAPMQMVFYTGDQFPEDYQGDAFVAMRGSWNRNPPSGYEVLRISFGGGEPVSFEPFVTGFLMEEEGQWGHLGRLAGIAQTPEGDLLVSDDTNGVIYRITYTGEEAEGGPSQLQPTNAEGANIVIAARDVSPPSGESASRLAVDIVGAAGELQVSSPAFENGEAIPWPFAAEGEDISPPLQWSEGPEGTVSYVVLMEDPDVQKDAPFVHWIMYNIPADTQDLPPGIPGRPILELPSGALHGTNDRGSLGYFGPRPPREDPAHSYHFQVFALDRELDLRQGAHRAEVLQAIADSALAAGTVMGTFER